MADASGPSEASKPAKRSFFKKPSWQTTIQKTGAKDDDPTAMFSRSSANFKDIVREQREQDRLQRERHKQRAEQRESEKGRKRRSGSHEDGSGSNSSIQKKRRDSEDTVLSPSRATRANQSSEPPSPSMNLRKKSPKSLSPRYEELMSRKYVAPKGVTVVDLDSSEDENVKDPTLASNPPDHITNLSVRKSPAKYGVPNEGQVAASYDNSGTAGGPSTSEEWDDDELEGFRASEHDADDVSTVGPEAYPTPVRDDMDPNAIVEVLVTTTLPNIDPLRIKIKYSMRYGEVRKGWLKHNAIGLDLRDKIVLAFKDQRVWDWTTSKTLGVNAETYEDTRQVEIVATTQESLDAAKKAKKKEKFPWAFDDSSSEEEVPKEVVKQVKIRLKAKGYDEFKLQVKPETTIDQVINAFRKVRKVPAEKKVRLLFDGERLQGDTAMQDSEIEDGDLVEVHIA